MYHVYADDFHLGTTDSLEEAGEIALGVLGAFVLDLDGTNVTDDALACAEFDEEDEDLF